MKMLGKNQHVTTIKPKWVPDENTWVFEVTTTFRKTVRMKVNGELYRSVVTATGVVHTSLYDIPDFGLIEDYVFLRKMRQYRRSIRKAHCMRVRRDRRAD